MTNPEDLLGSWSTATLRPRDLLLTFAGALRAVDEANEYTALVARAISRHALHVRLDISGYEDERAVYIIEDLTDALNDLAPEGIYFGASEGDGAEFGFWQADPEDQDDYLDEQTALAVEGED